MINQKPTPREVISALNNDLRYWIVARMLSAELSPSQASRATGVSLKTVIHHFGELRKTRLIEAGQDRFVRNLRERPYVVSPLLACEDWFQGLFKDMPLFKHLPPP